MKSADKKYQHKKTNLCKTMPVVYVLTIVNQKNKHVCTKRLTENLKDYVIEAFLATLIAILLRILRSLFFISRVLPKRKSGHTQKSELYPKP